MAAAGVLQKPQLRRLLEKKLRVAVIGACVASVVSGILWKLLIIDPKKRAYADFYKTYDAKLSYMQMCEDGVMTSCKPGDYTAELAQRKKNKQ